MRLKLEDIKPGTLLKLYSVSQYGWTVYAAEKCVPENWIRNGTWKSKDRVHAVPVSLENNSVFMVLEILSPYQGRIAMKILPGETPRWLLMPEEDLEFLTEVNTA